MDATATLATTASLSDYNALCKDLRATGAITACSGCGATDCTLYGYGAAATCLECA